MAYITQADKKELSPAIKSVLKKYGVKGSIGVNHYSTLVVNLKEGIVDFIGIENQRRKERAERNMQTFYPITDNYYQANEFYADEEPGIIGEFFSELIAAMKGQKWYDNSDSMIDYFDTAYYLNINVGKWNKPYNCTA